LTKKCTCHHSGLKKSPIREQPTTKGERKRKEGVICNGGVRKKKFAKEIKRDHEGK